MKFDFKNIYITGGSGWLGETLINTLMNGDNEVLEDFSIPNSNIYSLLIEKDCIINNFNSDNFNQIIGDIRSKNDCKNFLKNCKNELLIHCAGIIHPSKVSDFYSINLLGTKNLINRAIKNKIKKIIVISSNSPIGCNKSNLKLFNEESIYNPYMNYGKSKKLMEEFLLKKIEDGIDITIIRPPWFYGENMPERQLTFYKLIKEGRFPMIGSGNNIRSKVNIKNIVQGILLSVMNKKSKGQIYWIADEKPYTMNEIVFTVIEVLENEFNIKCKNNNFKFPFFIGQFFEFIDYFLQSIGLYNQKIHVASELNKNIACSIEKAKKDLGYKPKIALYDGIKLSLIGLDLNKYFNE